MNPARLIVQFVMGSARLAFRGSAAYWAWILVLLALMVSGARA